ADMPTSREAIRFMTHCGSRVGQIAVMHNRAFLVIRRVRSWASGAHMKRREFITLVGGAVAAWPIAARAQQRGLPVIGLLSSRSAATDIQSIAVFRQALNEGGFVEGQNVVIDYRWADGQYDRLPALAASLVRRQVAVIVTIGGEVSGLAA